MIPLAQSPARSASARLRCAALVGAKPAEFARRDGADVLPVATIAPEPAATSRVRAAREVQQSIVFTWKFRLRTVVDFKEIDPERRPPRCAPAPMVRRMSLVPRERGVELCFIGHVANVGVVFGPHVPGPRAVRRCAPTWPRRNPPAAKRRAWRRRPGLRPSPAHVPAFTAHPDEGSNA